MRTPPLARRRSCFRSKDQSSLTALNIRGLVDLDSLSADQRRGDRDLRLRPDVGAAPEYVTLRAQGLPSGSLQVLILGEAAFVALSGLAAGLLVGTGMGLLLVDVLQRFFILPPLATVPLGQAALIASLVAAATLVSALAVLRLLRRLSPSEVLREQLRRELRFG